MRSANGSEYNWYIFNNIKNIFIGFEFIVLSIVVDINSANLVSSFAELGDHHGGRKLRVIDV